MADDLAMDHCKSDIQQFYDGKTVFITGASGFLGRLLIEKLLRSCTGLKHIYILLREKKGKSPQERFKDMFDIPVFDKLRAQQSDFQSKISILEGDLTLPQIGLSESHQFILKDDVNCIFHVGATVRFDEKIRNATYTNVRSVRDLLRIAKEMKQLNSFVHISTAYSNCIHSHIEEKIYQPVVTSKQLLDLVELLDDKMLDAITPILLQSNPNTYVLTKSAGEDVVKVEGAGLPVAIVRPSIVISTYKEPIPGWIDNIYGVTSILVGASLGIIRTIQARRSNVADVVPADFVVNTMIVSAWGVARNNKNLIINDDVEMHQSEVQIFNYVSGPQNPITWGMYNSLAEKYAIKIPSPLIVWHANFTQRSNYYKHMVCSFLFQTVPAHVVDFLARCIGKEPMFVKIYQKVEKVTSVLAYFAMREWSFENRNTQNLWAKLNAKDKQLYNFNITCMTWDEYFQDYILGARIYLLRDPLDTIPQGRRKLLAVRIGHYILITVLCLLIYKLIMLVFSFI